MGPFEYHVGQILYYWYQTTLYIPVNGTDREFERIIVDPLLAKRAPEN